MAMFRGLPVASTLAEPLLWDCLVASGPTNIRRKPALGTGSTSSPWPPVSQSACSAASLRPKVLSWGCSPGRKKIWGTISFFLLFTPLEL